MLPDICTQNQLLSTQKFMNRLTVVEKKRTNSFTKLDVPSDAICLIGILPSDANDEQLCHQLRCLCDDRS